MRHFRVAEADSAAAVKTDAAPLEPKPGVTVVTDEQGLGGCSGDNSQGRHIAWETRQPCVK